MDVLPPTQPNPFVVQAVAKLLSVFLVVCFSVLFLLWVRFERV